MHTSQFLEYYRSILLVWSELLISIVSVCFQGFVSAVSHMRSFVPAVYDVTVAIPKTQPPPTMLRLFKGQSSAVSQQKLRTLYFIILYFSATSCGPKISCLKCLCENWVFISSKQIHFS